MVSFGSCVCCIAHTNNKKANKKNPCAQHSRLPVLPSGAALLLIPARILWDNLFEVCRKQTNDPLRPLHPATAPRPTKSPSRQDEKWHQSPTRRATRRDETKRNKREIRIKRAQEQNKRKNCTGTEREHTGLNKSVLRSAETDYLIPWALSLPCAVVPRSVPFAGGVRSVISSFHSLGRTPPGCERFPTTAGGVFGDIWRARKQQEEQEQDSRWLVVVGGGGGRRSQGVTEAARVCDRVMACAGAKISHRIPPPPPPPSEGSPTGGFFACGRLTVTGCFPSLTFVLVVIGLLVHCWAVSTGETRTSASFATLTS